MVYLAAALALVGTAGAADPYQIFAHARAVWAQQQYPDYLTYVVAVDVVEGGVQKTKHYHLAYDSQSGQIAVNPVSDEEVAAPPNPTGFVLHLQPKRNFMTMYDKRVGNPGEAVDYLGVPMIAPTYSFGMMLAAGDNEAAQSGDPVVAQIRREFDDPVPAEKTQQAVTGAGVRTIASVTSTVRRYTITLAGIESLAGDDCYHLKLQPNYDPQRFRLRDVWIDTHTYETRQLISAGNFSGTRVPWLVTFDDSSGEEYIASETALAPVGVGDHHYQSATVSFQTIQQAARPTRPANLFVTKENLMAEPGTTTSQ